jgi:hypothetical protein
VKDRGLQQGISRNRQCSGHPGEGKQKKGKNERRKRRSTLIRPLEGEEKIMGEEAVDGSKLGTKLIMFVAIIGLALAAFLLGKNLVNTGVDNLETSVKSITDSQFSDYDSKIVKGRVVKSAFTTFGNSEYALVVVTTDMATKWKAGSTVSADSDSTALGYGTITTVTKSVLNGDAHFVYVQNAGMQDSNGASVENAIGINYNAQLQLLDASGAAKYSDVTKEFSNNSTEAVLLTLENGVANYAGNFATDKGGNVKYYLYQVNISKKGQIEYVADSSSFNANLIKNASGDIMGILFTQRRLES